jgi:hypothetical protein
MPKIYVEKDGKRYRIEAHTLPEAIRQGATTTKKTPKEAPIELLMPITAKAPVKTVIETKTEVKEIVPEKLEVKEVPPAFDKPKRTRKK